MCFLTISLTVHLLARTLSADFQSTKLGSLLAGKIKKRVMRNQSENERGVQERAVY